MKKILNILNKALAYIFIGLIKIYQYTLSPDKGIPSFWLKGKICAHSPHCSQYGIQALKRYGFIPGITMTVDRITSCTPSNTKIYDPPFYKVVFFSSAPIGIPFLEELMHDPRFEVVGTVCSPDKPIGRGQKIQPNCIKAHACGLDITNIQTPNTISTTKKEGKEFAKWLKNLKPDFLVVISYGQIIPQEILDIPTKGAINLHGSLLPAYRGASPIQSVFLDNEKTTGLTVMLMNSGIDTGDILQKLEFQIPMQWTTLDVIHKFQEVGPKFLNNTIWEYGKSRIIPTPQDQNQATYCSKITKKQGEINIYKDTLQEIFNKYKAFYIWPKIYFVLDQSFGDKKGKTIIIEKLIVDENNFEQYKNKPLVNKDGQLNQAVQTLQVKPQGKKTMDWSDFLIGYQK